MPGAHNKNFPIITVEINNFIVIIGKLNDQSN
jgi:hypothetical protein